MNAEVSLPSFLFVGTAKAGTTSIANYLLQHPDVEIPMKETFYFLRDIYRNNHLSYPTQRAREEYVLETTKYESLYEGLSGLITGEVGTGYLFHHEVAIPRIKETLGSELKILMVLRNPIDRCYSSYQHFAKDLHETGSLEEAFSHEEKRQKEGWDFMWQHRLQGLYADQVRAYMDNFPNVKVLLYDDLQSNPEAFMKEVFQFIGLKPLENLDMTKSFNPSGEAKNKALQKFITHENPLKKLIRPVFRLFFSAEKRARMRKEMKAKNLTKSMGLSEEQRAELKAYYQEDVKKLSDLIGRSLDMWV